jgi:hypothetical protein
MPETANIVLAIEAPASRVARGLKQRSESAPRA